MRKLFCVLLVVLCGTVSYFDGHAQDIALPELLGQIAYIGTDWNVYTSDLQTKQTIALTDDANRRKIYQWPTWSTDGRLAYFSTTGTQQGFSTEVLISQDGITPGTSVYSSSTELFTYAYWSPQNCSPDTECRNLAVLFSNTNDPLFSVKLIHDDATQIPETLVGQGSPFYYSWSPDGGQMLWQRNNQEIDIYDVATGEVSSSLSQISGSFQAPGWSPVTNRWLFGERSENTETTDLVVVSDKERSVLASDLAGPIAFSWSPDGNLVAYMDSQGPLIIVDIVTGRTVARSSVNGVFAFFWSPNSEHIAYITLASAPGTFSADSDPSVKTAAYAQEPTGIAWSILDIDTGATRRYGAFIPTNEMIYLLSFFDQFAQSHRIWSPDSRYLVYSQTLPGNQRIINVIDTQQVDTAPFSIAEGRIGIWSFH